MRVRLLDHEGPQKIPVIVALLALFVLLVPGAIAPGQLLLTAPLAMTLFGLAVGKPFALRSRDVGIVLGPGLVRVNNRFAGFKVRPKDVVGSTTSLHDGKVALTIVLASRPHSPVTFVFDTPEDAEKMRSCLGLDRDGTGETHAPTEVPAVVANGRRLATIGAVLSLVGLCFLTVDNALVASGQRYGAAGFFLFFGVFAMLSLAVAPVALVASLMRFTRPPVEKTRRLALRRDALYVPSPTGATAIPYASIAAVAVGESSIHVTTHANERHEIPIMLPPDHVRVVASHVAAAQLRASSDAEQRGAVAEKLAFFARASEGESTAAWLGRVDALVAAMGASGYRGRVVDRSDLHAAAFDPDLALDYRLAATRALLKLEPETRIRIAELSESAPSPAHANLFRVADEPIEAVEAAYDAMVAEERATLKRRALP